MKLNWFILATILALHIQICFSEPKRSFGIGRSRPKSSNLSVRRRTHTETAPKPASSQAQQANSGNPTSLSGLQPFSHSYSRSGNNPSYERIKIFDFYELITSNFEGFQITYVCYNNENIMGHVTVEQKKSFIFALFQ